MNCIYHSTSKELHKHARKRAQKEEHAPREVSVSRKRVYESSSASSSAANDIDSDDVVHFEAILSHERPERLSATKASVDDRFILSTTFAFNIRSNVDCDPRIGSPSHARGTFEQREIGTRENTKREREETPVGGATRGDVREDSKVKEELFASTRRIQGRIRKREEDSRLLLLFRRKKPPRRLAFRRGRRKEKRK